MGLYRVSGSLEAPYICRRQKENRTEPEAARACRVEWFGLIVPEAPKPRNSGIYSNHIGVPIVI